METQGHKLESQNSQAQKVWLRKVRLAAGRTAPGPAGDLIAEEKLG